MNNLDLPWIRARFSGLSDELAFFENAGGSVPVDGVVRRTTDYLANDMVQLDASYPRSARATERVHAGFDAAGELVNADPKEIAFGGSTTTNMYVLSHAFAPLLERGDEVVVTEIDHEANRGAWIRMAKSRGAIVREWAFDGDTHELTMKGLDAVLGERTKLVCFSHCSNVVGSVHDAAAFVRRIHDAGARAVVDGVAFAPHRRVDVRAVDADAYGLSLYKVYGPHLGLMHVKPDLLDELSNQNHGFLRSSGMYTLMPGYTSHELAASVPGIVEYLKALDTHHDGQGTIEGAFDRIAAHEEAIAERLLSYLRERKDVRIIGRSEADRDRRAPTIVFTIDGRRSLDVVREIDPKGVAIRSGHFYAERAMEGLGIGDPEDGVIRASMVHYNTLEEVDRLVTALDGGT